MGVRSPVAHRAIDDILSVYASSQSIVYGVGNTMHSTTAHQSIAVSSVAMSGNRFTYHDGASSKNPDHCHSTINYLMVDGNKTSAVSHSLNDFCHTFASKS
jgi:hypothetical protein